MHKTPNIRNIIQEKLKEIIKNSKASTKEQEELRKLFSKLEKTINSINECNNQTILIDSLYPLRSKK